MKWYPIKDTKYFGKFPWADLDNSKSSPGKQVLTFPNGQKAHMKDSEVQKFFSLTDPDVEATEKANKIHKELAEEGNRLKAEEAERRRQFKEEAELQKQLELEEELDGLPEED